MKRHISQVHNIVFDPPTIGYALGNNYATAQALEVAEEYKDAPGDAAAGDAEEGIAPEGVEDDEDAELEHVYDCDDDLLSPVFWFT